MLNLLSEGDERQRALSNCLLELSKAQRRDRKIFLREIPQPEARPALTASVFVATTSETITPASGILICDDKLAAGFATIAGGGGALMGGSSLVAPNALGFALAAPAWSPGTPLLLYVYRDQPQPEDGAEPRPLRCEMRLE
jgi:hypothetical protein